MSLGPTDHLDHRLDFKPERAWPASWPAPRWNGFLLAGFGSTHPQSWNLSEQPEGFVPLFKDCHPQLSFAELARIYGTWSSVPEFIESTALDWETFFAAYQLRWNANLQLTFERLLATPEGFQTWVSAKAISKTDLAILRSIEKPEALAAFFEAIARMNPSKSTGAKILELGGELFLCGLPLDKLIPINQSCDEWLAQLTKKRHPLASENLQSGTQLIKSLPWPVASQAKWTRQGDEAGIEIRLFVRSKNDLTKKLEALAHVKKVMDEQECDPWKN